MRIFDCDGSMGFSELDKLKNFKEKRQREIVEEGKVLEDFYKKSVSFGDYFSAQAIVHKDYKAITDEYSKIEMTYGELEEDIKKFSSGLQSLGLSKGEFACIFSENNGRWVVIDQSITRCGAVSTLRGANAPKDELEYIMSHSECVGIILQHKNLYDKLKDVLCKFNLKFIVLMFDKTNAQDENGKVYSYNDVLQIGELHHFVKPKIELDDNYSMLYTSGTTGNPKGAIITHKNILSQLVSITSSIRLQAGEKSLEVLPVWHAYERTLQYSWFCNGAHVHFTTLSGLKKDLTKYQVDLICSVPRIWETIRIGIYQKLKQTSMWTYYFFDLAVKFSILYKIHKMYSERRITNKKTKYKTRSKIYHRIVRTFIKPIHLFASKKIYKKIRENFGLNFRISISGGGSLSMKDQLFYDAIGVNLREGYGLTETSPVVVMRKSYEPNYLGSAGQPLLATDIKIVDPDTLEEIGMYRKGVLLVKGPQIMKGYYKNKEATDAVLKDGWFNTGDLGFITKENNLVIIGRSKETIVLSSGENVEPIPIEAACLESPYIDQIVLVGQDEGSVGALVVPSDEALKKCGVIANELKSTKRLTIQDTTLRELIKKEINTYIKSKSQLKPFEKIKQFEILKNGFNLENGMLNEVSKIKRNVIFEKYSSLIMNMFSKNKKDK